MQIKIKALTDECTEVMEKYAAILRQCIAENDEKKAEVLGSVSIDIAEQVSALVVVLSFLQSSLNEDGLVIAEEYITAAKKIIKIIEEEIGYTT